ncbi:putative bifunctional diguanylate cyclase/phosphodiesterase [Mycolicibacterium mengxianglii]|uniref:putative bifunctional diguanylate cyclase/phosphodiesterase n=1 Tax=Mycolicibacterium mengxianglii TaxID=2736649 RepID=UPI0018EF0B3B|nr:bifunctional diguanylate cyclase/phosphodiesterase [Mycolicibacterium mengxianglii]
MSTFLRAFPRLVRASYATALAVVGTAVSFAVIAAAVFAGPATFWRVLCVGLVLTGLSAAWTTRCAARAAHGSRRAMWTCMTVGLLAGAVGSAVSVAQPPGPEPAPVLVGVGHVVFWLATCVALVVVPAARRDGSRSRLVLDALIVGAALFAVAWLLILRFTYPTDPGDTRVLLVVITYLAVTVVVTTMAVLLAARAGGRQRLPLLVLAAAITVMALTRATFVHLRIRGAFEAAALVGIGWLVGLLMIGVAAALSVNVDTGSVPTSARPRSSLWLPYLAVLIAGGVATADLISVPQLAPVVIATMVMVSAVVGRQLLALRDNRRLGLVIAEQALRDPLTGVGNRALFHDRLTHALHLRQRDQFAVSVLVLDLDDFKFVNSALGHPAGDSLLTALADRLLSCLRTGDTLARLGGDHFAVLMEGKAEGARSVAHRVAQSFDEPFRLEGHEVLIRPSIGLAAVTDGETDITAEVLLRRAEAAMYAAKAVGGSGLRSYTPDLDKAAGVTAGRPRTSRERNRAAATVHLLGELRRAIERDELAVVYQPQVDLPTRAVVSVEALVRWPHPRLGTLEPGRFLPVVRHHGLMPAVTDLVLRQALNDLASWRARGCAVPTAVNLFAPSLSDLTLPARIASSLAEHGVPPELLTLEVTEDLMLDDVRRTRAVLGDLRLCGIRIAIDDFGSGYSAFAYLRELPLDEIKICRQLIEPIVADPRADAVVRSIVELAHVLGARAVAEGVEDEGTDARLRAFGCDVGQGFLYSRPLSAAATTTLLCSQAGPGFDPSVSG